MLTDSSRSDWHRKDVQGLITVWPFVIIFSVANLSVISFVFFSNCVLIVKRKDIFYLVTLMLE